MAKNTKAEAKKNEGNTFFKEKDYKNAVKAYTEAIEIDETNHIYYSNRSAAYVGMNDYEKAAKDGEECVRLNPDFVKGYHRYALALKELKEYDIALDILKKGQKVDFNNKDLNNLINEIEPLLADVEASRRRKLPTHERIKEEGNDAFKIARFDEAIRLYTKAIESAPDKKKGDVVISCYNNRAACHQQLSNYSAVISDCSIVLEIDPSNQKALLRRGLAYEGLERYRLALQDIRALLAINPNIEIANKAQHRIGNAVRILQDSN